MNKKLPSVLIRTVIGAIALIALLFVAGIVVGYFAAQGSLDGNRASIWVVAAAAVIGMAGSMVVSIAWMRSIDEAAREAHKAAWFWGGSGGMAVGGVLMMMAALPQSAHWRFPSWFDGRTDGAAYAATGAFGMILIMVIGYTIAWAWWWWRRR